MKKICFSLLCSLALFAAQATTTPGVDLEKSNVSWTGAKVTGSHTGTIAISEANLEMSDAGDLVGGSFVIDMSTITCTDLDGEMKGKLEGHLQSPDFFDVANHSTATLAITNVSPRGPGSYKVLGDLTIKGITKPIKFNVEMGEDEGMKVATADIEVDRSEYDVRYGSGSFFQDLADKTIYDEFDLQVKLVLN